MSHPLSSRRRGGQPGNVNRLKHGLYSQRLTPSAGDALLSPGADLDPEFQLSFARKRLAQLLDRQQSAPQNDWLSYERSIMHYLHLITGLLSRRARPHPTEMTEFDEHDGHPFVGILESIRVFDTDLVPGLDSAESPIRTSEGASGNYP